MPSVNPLSESTSEETKIGLPRQQKIAVVFLAFLSISIIIIWALQFNSQVYKPFKVPKNNNKNIATTTDTNLIDSDGDTLTDYEENNVYKTSVYLEDSDSDGINDNQEVAAGTNPNCPTGQNCGLSESLATTNASSSVEQTPSTNNSNISDPAQVTPAMLRQVLLQSGYDQATLDKISDEEIMKSYQEALKTQSENNSVSTSSVSTSTNQ